MTLSRITFSILLLFLVACKKDDPKSNTKSISSFVFLQSNNKFLTGDLYGIRAKDTIVFNVSKGTPLNNLTPTIKFDGVSISPANEAPQDFTNPVIYTVTAEDGSTKSYTILMHSLSTSNNITSFILRKADNPSLINDIIGSIINDTVRIPMQDNIDASGLIPTITIDGISVNPSSGTPVDFTKTLLYGVTAENGYIKTYKVISSADHYVYAGSSDGYLYALDAVTGKLVWQYHAGGQISSPVCGNGLVYASNGKSLFALDQNTGAIKWSNNGYDGIFSTVTVVDGTLYAGYRKVSPIIYSAFDALTGILKWEFKINSAYGAWFSTPTVVNNVMYFKDISNGVTAVDATTGLQKWNHRGDLSIAKPCVQNDIVYFSYGASLVAALDAANGNLLWEIKDGGNVKSNALVANNIIYIGGSFNSGRATVAIDANTQKQIWNFTIDINSPVFISPYLSDNTIYAANDNTLLYALNAVDGVLKWTFFHDDGPYQYATAPMIAAHAGLVFLSRNDNYLYCLDASNGSIKWKFEGNGPINTYPCVINTSGDAFFLGKD